MNLPEALRHYRKVNSLVQKEVAWTLGITREHYALIEEGHASPSPRLLSTILEKLQIRLEFTLAPQTRAGDFETEGLS